MAKYNLPDIYIGEYLEYQQLLLKYPNRSTTGVFTFTSPTSNITYSTNDYPNNPNIYNRGELGMMNLLAELYGGPGNGFIVDVQDLGVSFALTPATPTSLGGVKVSQAGGNATVLMDGSNTIYVPLSQSGALTANNGLGVNVDNNTITINDSNQLQANADQSLSDTSTNPVANKVVYQSLQRFSATIPITPFTISSGTSWTQLSSPASWDTDGVYLYTYTYTYNGLTSSDYLDIVLDSKTLMSGIIAPVVNSVDNGIQFWASEQPSNSIQVVGGVYTTTVLSALNLEV